jgi:phospholipid N-methyltransferase
MISVAIDPEEIRVLHLKKNDVLFVNADAIDIDKLRGNFPCPVIPVMPRATMSVAEEIAVVRKAE